jgi:hypothetical protein
MVAVLAEDTTSDVEDVDTGGGGAAAAVDDADVANGTSPVVAVTETAASSVAIFQRSPGEPGDPNFTPCVQ